MPGRVLYLVGGAPRVGKSALAQRLLESDGIPWLPTDVLRTVLRRVLPELDAVDRDPVDAARLAELMYPHIERGGRRETLTVAHLAIRASASLLRSENGSRRTGADPAEQRRGRAAT